MDIHQEKSQIVFPSDVLRCLDLPRYKKKTCEFFLCFKFVAIVIIRVYYVDFFVFCCSASIKSGPYTKDEADSYN